MNFDFFTKETLEKIDYQALSFSEIASIIIQDWIGVNEDVFTLELVRAMGVLKSIDDIYYSDSGIRVICELLPRLRKWNTYKSKFIKNELKKRVAEYNKKYDKLRN